MPFMLKCPQCRERISPEDPVVRRARRCPYCVAVLDLPLEDILLAWESLRKESVTFALETGLA